MIHLTIGDTWNSINNYEQRRGTAVAGVFLVWLSALAATFSYFTVLPIAGLLLVPMCTWLSIAGCLIWSIWRLNGSDPVLPRLAPPPS
mmetsp:Transcript_45417/g.95197  ORF Transcript_45417/g.95197 Transcript_45417/m.95197 type:complete len:88 (-) Transcript_45417:454-717(-)